MITIKQHTLIKSIALHLLPGFAGTLAYIVLSPILINHGYPALLAILSAAALIILPILLGILFTQSWRNDGTFSLKDILPYRQPLPWWQYILIPLGLVIWGFVANGLTAQLDERIAKMLFSWLPEWFFIFDLQQFEAYSRPALMTTFVVGLVINGFVLPWVEELYFRGYLLPRLNRFGKWAPLINLSLFSLYHFWTPWQFFSRILWMLPWVYTVWYKRNVVLIIITHCTVNTIGWLLSWLLILG